MTSVRNTRTDCMNISVSLGDRHREFWLKDANLFEKRDALSSGCRKESSKSCYLSTEIHDVTSHKSVSFTDTTVRVPNVKITPTKRIAKFRNKVYGKCETNYWNIRCGTLLPYATYCSTSALTQPDGSFVVLHYVEELSVTRRFRINSKKRL